MDKFPQLNILIIDPENDSMGRLIFALKPYQSNGEQKFVSSISKTRKLEESNDILLNNPDINCIFIDVVNTNIERASKFIFNIRNKLPQIVFVLYNDSDEVEKLGDDFHFGERIRFKHYFLLNKKSHGEKLDRKLIRVLHFCMSDIRLQLSFERQKLVHSRNVNNKIPVEITESLEMFYEKYRNVQTAFIMMSFENSETHNKIAKEIKETLKSFAIVGLKADDEEFHENLYDNIRTYMHGCDIGISVFESISNPSINANISFETGYVKALFKPVCIMKDKSIPSLQSDLLGSLFTIINTHDISSIDRGLKLWIGRKLTSKPK